MIKTHKYPIGSSIRIIRKCKMIVVLIIPMAKRQKKPKISSTRIKAEIRMRHHLIQIDKEISTNPLGKARELIMPLPMLATVITEPTVRV